MIGAIIGDIVGSRFEWHRIKSKDFDFFSKESCKPTDDSVMTLAVAQAILDSDGDINTLGIKTVKRMREFGNRYPYAGYGDRFWDWLREPDPQPYKSWGNGAAMRVSPCGFAAKTVDEVKLLSKTVTEVTHNHPEGIKGAEATAVAVFLARTGSTLSEIQEHINKYYYKIDFKLDDIREDYTFDVSCKGSVPQAMEAFFESTCFEDAVRNAVSIGGDSDTLAAIAGSVAGAYYGIPDDIRKLTLTFLDEFLKRTLYSFEEKYGSYPIK